MRLYGNSISIVLWGALLPAFMPYDGHCAEAEIRGLTEPFRNIDVAATEAGVLAELLVKEGDTVKQGDELARLNCESLTALLAISKQSMESKGRLLAVQAELKLR